MDAIYTFIINAKNNQQKLLAILIDPDKLHLSDIHKIANKIEQSPANLIFVGGSVVDGNNIDLMIIELKKYCSLPIILFPGHPSQISSKADGLLFLSLISGRNPDYLIENQIKAVSIIKKTRLEVIPTAYILVKTGQQTAVERVSKTEAMSQDNPEFIVETAQAGEMLGHKMVYLEAGSGACQKIATKIISMVARNTKIPLIVGGGIKLLSEIDEVFAAGADVIVIGTAFENDQNFFTA